MPINFDVPVGQTVSKDNKKQFFVKTIGLEKSRVTFVLSCMADDIKLTRMVILENKYPKQKFPKGIIFHVHEKGWMDEGSIQIWQKNVWNF